MEQNMKKMLQEIGFCFAIALMVGGTAGLMGIDIGRRIENKKLLEKRLEEECRIPRKYDNLLTRTIAETDKNQDGMLQDQEIYDLLGQLDEKYKPIYESLEIGEKTEVRSCVVFGRSDLELYLLKNEKEKNITP